jgi:hypothetical protein
MTEESKPRIENLETPEQELTPEEAEQAEGGFVVIGGRTGGERGFIIEGGKTLGGPDTLAP